MPCLEVDERWSQSPWIGCLRLSRGTARCTMSLWWASMKMWQSDHAFEKWMGRERRSWMGHGRLKRNQESSWHLRCTLTQAEEHGGVDEAALVSCVSSSAGSLPLPKRTRWSWRIWPDGWNRQVGARWAHKEGRQDAHRSARKKLAHARERLFPGKATASLALPRLPPAHSPRHDERTPENSDEFDAARRQ